MSARILVDTNVILYSRDGRFPEKRNRCAAWLKRLADAQALVISPQAAGEHQVNAQGKLGESQADAARTTQRLLTWCMRPVNAEDVERALKIEARWRVRWWDAMHLSYAVGAGCTHFLTEDAQSAPTIEGVKIIDPFVVAPDDVLGAQ